MFKHKIRKKIALTVLIGFTVAPELHAMHIAALEVCAWVLKAQAIKYIARSIPGVGAAYLAKNIIDIGSGSMPQLELPDSVIEALKQSQEFQNLQQLQTVAVPSSPVSDLVQNTISDVRAASSSSALCTSIPSAFQTFSGGTSTIALMPTNVDWRAGVAASSQLRDSFFQSMQSPKGLVSFSTQINGQTQLVRQGTSPLGVRLAVDTGPDTSWGPSAARAFQDQLHQTRLQQAALHEVPQLQQAVVNPVERSLVGIINSEHISVIDAVKMMQKLDTCVAKSAHIVQQKIDACKLGQFHPELLQGVQGAHADVCRTVSYIKGALCDSGGNIIGLQSDAQRTLLTQIYGHHCACQGYGTEAVFQRAQTIIDQSLHRHLEEHSFKVNSLQDTSFNKDLLCAINYVQHGYASHAQALINAYNPEKFGHISNWWHNRHQLYQVAQDAYASAYKVAYTSDGVFKPFTQHPLWEQLSAAMQNDPALTSQIMRKLHNEYAFSLQTLQRLNVMQPTSGQLTQMFELCQYAYLDGFEKSMHSLRNFTEVGSFLETCAQKHSFFESLRSTAGCGERFWNHVLQHQELLSQVAHDPQLSNILGTIGNVHDVGDAMQLLQERLRASDTLLQRCGVVSPHALSRVLSYHLVDNFHDPHAMFSILSELDPHHANSMVRASYHDFFDEYGLQKLLPIKDTVRRLFQEQLGNAFTLNDHAALRDAFNKLTVITPRNAQDVAILQRGFGLFEQALSSGVHAPLFADYAPQFVEALTRPTDVNRGVLSWCDLFDAYRCAPDGDVKISYGNLLESVLDKTKRCGCPSPELDSLMGALRDTSKYIQSGDISAARGRMSPWVGSPSLDTRIARSVPHVPGTNSLPSSSLPLTHDGLGPRGGECLPKHEPLPATSPKPEPPLSVAQSSKPEFVPKIGLLKSAQPDFDWQKAFMDAAKVTAAQHVVRRGFPGLPYGQASSSSSVHTQRESDEQCKKRMLLNWALKERAEQAMLGDTKGKGKSRFGLSRAFLEDGDIVAQTKDGVVVQDEDTFAHVHRDGSVEIMHPQNPEAFAQEMRQAAKNNATRASSSSASSSQASTSQDGGYEDFEDWLNTQKKRHASRGGSQSAKAVPSCSGGGDPDPPDDPRNNRNKGRQSRRPRDLSDQKATPEQKKGYIEIVKRMGFTKVGERSHGEAIFRKGDKYISFDECSHNGGVWKMAKSVDKLKSRTSRLGTYDQFLRCIGD